MYLADSLVNALAEHVATHGTTGRARWLFAGEGDDPPHQNTVGCWWRKTLRDADLTGNKLHDLRHFYASGLIAAGCDVVTVRRSLGHAKATTTLNTYAHLWPTAENRTRKAPESIMTVSLGRPPRPSPTQGQVRVGERVLRSQMYLAGRRVACRPGVRHSAHYDAPLEPSWLVQRREVVPENANGAADWRSWVRAESRVLPLTRRLPCPSKFPDQDLVKWNNAASFA